MNRKEKRPKLYRNLASWFHLLTAPADYAEEARRYRKIFVEASAQTPIKILELGSGGGNNALHLKKYFNLTLTDISPEILKLSRKINPKCEHIVGDMRTLRLNRKFDGVFVHDAISYITDERDLLAAIKTSFVHCRPGGIALFCPDFFRETFKPKTSHGGHDEKNRGLRYLEWIHDPNPKDTKYIQDFAYLLREGEKVHGEYDRHMMGVFKRSDWTRFLVKVGFIPFKGKLNVKTDDVVIGVKPKK